MRPATICFSLALAASAAAGVHAQTFPTLPPGQPAGTGVVEPCEMERTAGDVRCGVYRVFEDREAAAGRTIDLAFVVLKALDPAATASDVILPLPGGPGQAFTGAGAGFAARNAEHRRSRDILLVDVRGVGRSGSLDCPDFEIEVSARFGTVFPPEHIAMCRAALAERARLDLYTTDMSVDDLEELRRWLRYDSVNLMGGSYGTLVAQVYMRRHPEAVRTVVLNSVAPVSGPGYVGMARSLERSLDLVVEACQADEVCARENPELRLRLGTVLERLGEGPAELEIDGTLVGFTKGDFAYSLRGLLYGRAAEVPAAITRAWRGDFDEIASYYLQRSGWVGSRGGEAGYHFSALCPEDILTLTDADVERASTGTFMGDHLIAGYRAVCEAWRVSPRPASFREPVRSDLPTLIISGERDPVTPPAAGDAVGEHLANSIHVIVPGGGHGPSSSCTRALELQLLEEASVAGLDPSCGAGGV